MQVFFGAGNSESFILPNIKSSEWGTYVKISWLQSYDAIKLYILGIVREKE